eukprot:5771072-Pyramimonas_sp.AAC.2
MFCVTTCHCQLELALSRVPCWLWGWRGSLLGFCVTVELSALHVKGCFYWSRCLKVLAKHQTATIKWGSYANLTKWLVCFPIWRKLLSLSKQGQNGADQGEQANKRQNRGAEASTAAWGRRALHNALALVQLTVGVEGGGCRP